MHFLCVLQTLVGGRGSSRNRCSEPDRDQYQETVSFLQTCTSKVGEASLEVEGRLVSEQRLSSVAGFLARRDPLFHSAGSTPRH